MEYFVSVDIETSGPIPGEFSLLSIGACVVYDSNMSFSCELKPINDNADPDALAVTGLSLARLKNEGLEAQVAMGRFASWLKTIGPAGRTLVFVGLNAPFDWSFVNYYFLMFHGSNPFGFSALDIKAYYLGRFGGDWADTRSSCMDKILKPKLKNDHTALGDAQYQAELFRRIQELA